MASERARSFDFDRFEGPGDLVIDLDRVLWEVLGVGSKNIDSIIVILEEFETEGDRRS